MTKILNDLGFIVKSNRNFLNLKVPSWRPDITQEIDVIEELKITNQNTLITSDIQKQLAENKRIIKAAECIYKIES